MERFYLICYDITDNKRAYRVRKLAYKVALGGQKSALESYLTKNEALNLAEALYKKINPDEDRINIVEIEKEVLLFGKAKNIPINENGDIVI